jgi:hypothetical protein
LRRWKFSPRVRRKVYLRYVSIIIIFIAGRHYCGSSSSYSIKFPSIVVGASEIFLSKLKYHMQQERSLTKSKKLLKV